MLVAIIITGCGVESNSSNQSISVFAAASLTDILNELVQRFELDHPNIKVHTHIGPTSLLARQIERGAPADVFMAASPEWIHFLSDQSLIQGSGTRLAGNTLVIMGTSTTEIFSHLSEITTKRIAMADPSHVPAGVYAKQALQCAGLWETIESNVIPTLDARSALTAVTSGAAELVMVYGSDRSLVPELKAVFQISDFCTPEINYMISVLRASSNPELSQTFLSFATDSLHHSLWIQFGFSL